MPSTSALHSFNRQAQSHHVLAIRDHALAAAQRAVERCGSVEKKVLGGQPSSRTLLTDALWICVARMRERVCVFVWIWGGVRVLYGGAFTGTWACLSSLPVSTVSYWLSIGLPSLQLTWHLTEGPFRSKLIFQVPSNRCYASGREGSVLVECLNTFCLELV